MGLFDHLFKPKPEPAGEESGEAPAKQPDDAARRGEAEAPEADPSAFLQPKGYGASAADPVAPVPPAAVRPAERKPGPAPAQDKSAGKVVLTLSDILPRIPTHFLSTGMHDLRRELRFEISALSSEIARGRPSVPLSTIAALCPEIFHSPIGPLEDIDIRLPLQKLVEQIGRIRADSGPRSQGPEVPAAAAHEALRPAESPAENAQAPAAGNVDSPSPESPPFVTPPETPLPPIRPPLAETPAEEHVRIRLSVAALLPGVPIEIRIDPLPHVDERVRIALPFAPIEWQLAGGKVELPSELFVSALPPELRPYFAAREGVKVPLPLEEIFQNLPNGDGKPVPGPTAEESLLATPQASLASMSTQLPPASAEEAAPPSAESAPASTEAAPPASPAGGPPADPAPASGPPLTSTAVAEPIFSAEAIETDPSAFFSKASASSALEQSAADLEEDSGTTSEPDAAPATSAAPPAESPLAPPVPPAAVPPPAASEPAGGVVPQVQLPPIRLFAPPPPIFTTAKAAAPAADTAAHAAEPAVAPVTEPEPPKTAEPIAAVNIPDSPPEPAPPAEPESSAPFVPAVPAPVHLKPAVAEAETPAPILHAASPEPSAGTPTGRPLILQPPLRFGQLAPAATPPAHATPPPAPEPASPAASPAPSLAASMPDAPASNPPLHEVARATAPIPAPTPDTEPAPASFPLTPFGQENVQALFMTDEVLDLQKISRLAAELPGVQACVIATRETAVTGGLLPEGFDVTALLGLAPRVGEAAGRLPIGALKHFTLYGERYSVSFFERSGLCLCAVHRARSFVPGVREKLVALADELAG